MAITLRKLADQEIPTDRRKAGLVTLFAVEDSEGQVSYYESDVDAAHRVALLQEQAKSDD